MRKTFNLLFTTRRFSRIATIVPSAIEPPSSTPATYSSMVKNERGRKRPVRADAPPSPSSHHNSDTKSTTTTPSQPDRHPQQQPPPQQQHRGGRGRGRGGGRGSHTSTYYQTPPPSHQPQNQHPRQARRDWQHSNREQAAHEEDVYVLTLLTDPAHERAMSALRRQWFPARWLKVDAHMTLFHALPGQFLDTIKKDLAETAARTQEFAVEVDLREDVWRMGRKGVAVQVRGPCEGMVGKMRRWLIDRWEQMGEETAATTDYQGNGANGGEGKTHGVLSAQDARRRWKAHYTIMNKEEDPARVEECFNDLRGGGRGSSGLGLARSGTVLGLRLWRYDRGWWRQEEDFLFGGGNSQPW